MIGSCTSFLVAISSLFVPKVKSKFGFKKGITLSQTIAVLALIVLATTEFFKDYWFALPIAISCYLLRAPLMNLAAPMTSEPTIVLMLEKQSGNVKCCNVCYLEW